MTPINVPLPTVQPPTAGEAAAAKKVLNKESSSDFPKTLEDVSATEKAAKQKLTESHQASNPKEETKKAANKGEKSEPESASTEKTNREERMEKNRKTTKKGEGEEAQPVFAALPEGVQPPPPAPVDPAVELSMAKGGTVTQVGLKSASSPIVMPNLADGGEVTQGMKSGTLVIGKNSSFEGGGLPFELRPPASRNGQAQPSINRSPLSAQSPKFSQELAERVGNLRLISRAGVSDQVRINLVPRDLGNLDIRLQVDGDSRVHMMVTAESEAAKDLLKNQISQLKEALIKQGMEFGDVDIQVDVKQREAGAETQAELAWGGDGRFRSSDGQRSGQGKEADGGGVNEERLILGKVIRSSDGGMSVFI
ncbi:MAG: flagellar hook-length control protein FliK [Magnetococcales bacterium]|nr:flagellar hook-length control protein FliK [Magnetococcales bacterium]